MDEEKKQLWKIGGALFALIIAGSWIWSWIFPPDPNRYQFPTPEPTQSVAPNIGQGSTNYYVDPCEDEPTVEDYKYCLESQALEDWAQDRESEAGLP